MSTREPDLRRWSRRRLRLLGGGALVGVVVGFVATVALAFYGGTAVFATRKAFALGALVLGFAVLGWSGSVIAGRGVENLQRRLDRPGDWSEADSRRAMARIAGFGAGMMITVALVEILV